MVGFVMKLGELSRDWGLSSSQDHSKQVVVWGAMVSLAL